MGLGKGNIDILYVNEIIIITSLFLMPTYSFARSRLRTCHQISSRHYHRQGMFLHWRWFCVPRLPHIIEDKWAEACGFETVYGWWNIFTTHLSTMKTRNY